MSQALIDLWSYRADVNNIVRQDFRIRLLRLCLCDRAGEVGEERRSRIAVSGESVSLLRETTHARDQNRLNQSFLGRKVSEERAYAHSCPMSYLLSGGRGTFGGKDNLCCLKDAHPVSPRVGA